ncbi:MAG: hypothetical protein HON90_06760 [Halobacteriovoraceae bacterium]|nr:hypothetical protein [Halobacteriovoraceae bacterium]
MTKYDKILEWLYSQLPMYQRMGKAAYKADLDRFTCSANNFTATGFASRHANYDSNPDQVRAIQSKFISIDDSRELFKSIFTNFIKIL